MVQEIPKVALDGRYELRQASKLLGVSSSTLLRYTHRGYLRTGIRKYNKRHFWLGAELVRFWKETF